ncbi:4'-phosphopantetheinyl transferase family protein [Pectinatus frisingensis]|uniref:4'-phosphopantetheinyl transferase family protein n=1 Tax=Pectinatus frisingensis TaxID=865 RepID=UPI0015F6E5D0|nr:4'-phosphopantetheinyl transferase superfamily protein [Pectinatus frisingensis]
MEIYIADNNILKNSKLFSRAIQLLPERRQKKLKSGTAEKTRMQSAGAGLLLDYILKKHEIYGENAEIYTNGYGKPYLRSGLLYFNLSHSGEYILCAVDKNELGADIQKSNICHMDLAKRFLHTDEYDYLIGLPTEKQTKAFFRIWTLKESYIKALGRGIAGMLDTFAIKILADGAAAYQENKLLPYQFIEYEFTEYHIAVCTTGITSKPALQQVDFADLY